MKKRGQDMFCLVILMNYLHDECDAGGTGKVDF